MSDRPVSILARFDEAIAALALIEAQIANVRLMVEHNAQQADYLLQATIAWGRMSKSERAQFCKEHGFIQAPAPKGGEK